MSAYAASSASRTVLRRHFSPSVRALPRLSSAESYSTASPLSPTLAAPHHRGLLTYPFADTAHRFAPERHCQAPHLILRRSLHSTSIAQHGPITRPEPGTGIKLTFKDAKGNDIKTVEANEGDDILSIAHEHDIDLEGACEGSVACSTCHVILSQEHYDKLPEPEDDENDMLDMAFGLTDTSRLGCQVHMTRELDGMTATLPSATRNMFVDGKKPTHH